MPTPSLQQLFGAAVAAVGGAERAGQVRMTRAVQQAAQTGEHLLVQAGTGTGKSLAYLVPAIEHARSAGRPVVVATATLALQAQVVDRELPRLADALTPLLGARPTYGLVKGRRNYLCKHKLEGGYPDEEETLLEVGQVDAAAGRVGAEVVRLREWAQETASGDRDDLVPGVSETAWRQVSVSARECLGSRCPLVAECFVEQARAQAKEADVVVTNHALLAIDAFEGRQILPQHDLLVVDEAHELIDRVTSVVTGELLPAMVTAAVRKIGRLADTDALAAAGDGLERALEPLQPGRIDTLPQVLALALARVRDTARDLQSELKPASAAENDGARQLARAAVDELFDQSERILEERQLDVLWLADEQRRGPVLRVAPMTVAMQLRERLFGERTVVLTSATLELGGSFDAIAGRLGLAGEGGPRWQGLDVGSPFDYTRQAMVYVARHLPPPGRDGPAEATLDEIEALVRAAGGRTLGLFSSRRAATDAAEQMRSRLGPQIPVLCQGDDQMPTLVRQFAADARTCLFGTMSLWQGVDVPGPACQLVIIDRIPFPRPDDPLASARSEEVSRRGGNGFMTVSATHAALRLAQGAGRLVRRGDDRGVVALLDPRMTTARYAGFLQRSLPPFWPTTDRAMVLAALARLDAAAGPLAPVTDPAPRGPVAPVPTPDGPAETAATPAAQVPAPAAEAPSPSAPAGGRQETLPDADADDSPPESSARQPSGAGGSDAVPGEPDAPAGEWSDEEDEELRDAAEMGLTAQEVAEHLDRPAQEVARRAATLGVRLEDGVEPQD